MFNVLAVSFSINHKQPIKLNQHALMQTSRGQLPTIQQSFIKNPTTPLPVSLEERIKALEEELNKLKDLAKQQAQQPQPQTQPQPKHEVKQDVHQTAIKAKPHVHRFTEVWPGVYRCVGCGTTWVDSNNVDAVLNAFAAVHRHGDGAYDIFNCPVCRPKLENTLKRLGYGVEEKDGAIILRRVKK